MSDVASSVTDKGVAMKSNCSREPAGDGTAIDSMLFGLRNIC